MYYNEDTIRIDNLLINVLQDNNELILTTKNNVVSSVGLNIEQPDIAEIDNTKVSFVSDVPSIYNDIPANPKYYDMVTLSDKSCIIFDENLNQIEIKNDIVTESEQLSIENYVRGKFYTRYTPVMYNGKIYRALRNTDKLIGAFLQDWEEITLRDIFIVNCELNEIGFSGQLTIVPNKHIEYKEFNLDSVTSILSFFDSYNCSNVIQINNGLHLTDKVQNTTIAFLEKTFQNSVKITELSFSIHLFKELDKLLNIKLFIYNIADDIILQASTYEIVNDTNMIQFKYRLNTTYNDFEEDYILITEDYNDFILDRTIEDISLIDDIHRIRIEFEYDNSDLSSSFLENLHIKYEEYLND